MFRMMGGMRGIHPAKRSGRSRLSRLGWIPCLALAASIGQTRAAEQVHATAAESGNPLDVFVSRLTDEQRARVAPIVKAAGPDEEARRSVLLETLAVLNPDLGRARDLLTAEQPEEALPILERLAGSQDAFVATHAVWLRVRAMVGLERYEDAMAALKSAQTNAVRYTQVADDMLFTEGGLHACLLDRPAAVKILKQYLERFPSAPADRRGAAQELLAEVQGIEETSLPQVAALMNDSRRRLRLGDTGDLTLSRQKQIESVLEKVIELEEEKKKGAGRGPNAPGGGGKSGKAQKSSGDKPGAGARESELGEKDSETRLHASPKGGNPDDWARAYARDRETVQRELQTRIPERYRELIEQYYQSLSAEGTAGRQEQR